MAEAGNSAAGGADRFKAALAGGSWTHDIVTLPDSTRTAQEAALAVGCDVAQIVKSLVFRGTTSGRPVLVIACGANRVDEALVGTIIGEPIGKANANFVRENTGYAIGGVPPLGHAVAPVTLIDEDLLPFDTIWAAAGTPNAVFQLTPDDLVAMTGGQVVAVKQR